MLSQLAETLIGSEIVKLGNEIAARKRNGEQIYNYTIGDFDPNIFPLPEAYEEEIIKAYQAHYTNYPAAEGILELRQSVAAFYKKQLQLDYAVNEIQIASGGRPLIYSAFKAIVDKDDTVIYAAPSWNNNHYTHMNGGRHCVINTSPEHDFMPRAADIAPHIKGAALLCLCTPQNPTGTTLNKTELEKICDLVVGENNSRPAGQKKLYVLFDQMYFTLTYGSIEHYNPVSLCPEMKAYTIFIDGVSKAFAATGVRVGWAAGPDNVITKMKALLSHIGAWAPMAEQKATAFYLQNDTAVNSHLEQFRKQLELRLHAFYNGFTALRDKGYNTDAVAPQAALYLTVKLDLKGKSFKGKVLETQADVTQFTLAEAKLAIVPFSAFGADKNSPWYRVSIGTCTLEEIEQMFTQLEHTLALLQ